MYCLNLVFNLKLLKKNIGFFIMIIFFFLQILFFFIYLIKKLKPLKNFMLIFRISYKRALKSFPPFKNKGHFINNSPNENNQNNNGLQDFLKNKNKNLINLKPSFSKQTNDKNHNNIIPLNESLIISSKFAPSFNMQIINIIKLFQPLKEE